VRADTAPAKHLEWFEHSGHNPCYEEPERFNAFMTGRPDRSDRPQATIHVIIRAAACRRKACRHQAQQFGPDTQLDCFDAADNQVAAAEDALHAAELGAADGRSAPGPVLLRSDLAHSPKDPHGFLPPAAVLLNGQRSTARRTAHRPS
jgi:hypothetical protein